MGLVFIIVGLILYLLLSRLVTLIKDSGITEN